MCKHEYVHYKEDLTWDSANFHMVDTLHDKASQSDLCPKSKLKPALQEALRIECIVYDCVTLEGWMEEFQVCLGPSRVNIRPKLGAGPETGSIYSVGRTPYKTHNRDPCSVKARVNVSLGNSTAKQSRHSWPFRLVQALFRAAKNLFIFVCAH